MISQKLCYLDDPSVDDPSVGFKAMDVSLKANATEFRKKPDNSVRFRIDFSIQNAFDICSQIPTSWKIFFCNECSKFKCEYFPFLIIYI